MTAPRRLSAIALGCALLVAGCGGDPPPQHEHQQQQASRPTGTQPVRTTSAARVQAPHPGARAATSPQQPSTTAVQRPAAPVARTAPVDVPLTERVLTPADLGHGWLMQKPDDEAAAKAKHEFCAGPFQTDAARRERVERNFADNDGLRVQQELNRYATEADAERALQEFASTFADCSSYEPQPGLRIELSAWAAPSEAQQRVGTRMTFRPTAQPTVHAALAVYRSGDVVMVLSAVAEQSDTAATWHTHVAPTAIRRALMAPYPHPEETR